MNKHTFLGIPKTFQHNKDENILNLVLSYPDPGPTKKVRIRYRIRIRNTG
jgi:hypothetical protein